jgi:hypothetical protein
MKNWETFLFLIATLIILPATNLAQNFTSCVGCAQLTCPAGSVCHNIGSCANGYVEWGCQYSNGSIVHSSSATTTIPTTVATTIPTTITNTTTVNATTVATTLATTVIPTTVIPATTYFPISWIEYIIIVIVIIAVLLIYYVLVSRKKNSV